MGHVINRNMTTLRLKTNLFSKNLESSSQYSNSIANVDMNIESEPRIVASDSVTSQTGIKGLLGMLSQFVTVGGDFV